MGLGRSDRRDLCPWRVQLRGPSECSGSRPSLHEVTERGALRSTHFQAAPNRMKCTSGGRGGGQQNVFTVSLGFRCAATASPSSKSSGQGEGLRSKAPSQPPLCALLVVFHTIPDFCLSDCGEVADWN